MSDERTDGDYKETELQPKGNSRQSRKKIFTKKNIPLIIVGIIILGAATAAILLKASTYPFFCSTCHIIRPVYQSWSGGDLLDNKHAVAGVECLDCHHRTIPEKIQEGTNFITGNYTLPLEGPTGNRDFCLACHTEGGAGESWDEIKLATDFEESNPHDNHNGELECNICHSMHQQSQLLCAECHTFNWMNDLDGSWKK